MSDFLVRSLCTVIGVPEQACHSLMLRSILSAISEKCVNLDFKNNYFQGTSHLNTLHSLVTLPQSVPDVDHVLSGATVAALRHGGVGGVRDAVEK